VDYSRTVGEKYDLSIVQRDEQGRFDLVVQNSTGRETDRLSLNKHFGDDTLEFTGTIELIPGDYNNDRDYDFPIGFLAGDDSGEFKYALFTIRQNGTIYNLSATGYKDDGYIYTLADTHSIDFTGIPGIGEGRSPGMLVGVQKEGGGYEGARYVWNGDQFEFHKQGPVVLSQAEVSYGEHSYIIRLLQTEYKKPRTPDDEGFSLYESKYLGSFDLVIQNSAGEETGRLSVNKYFGDQDIGFPGEFDMVLTDCNMDGDLDLAIGRLGGECQYALFSVNTQGQVYNLPAVGYKTDGYIYSWGEPLFAADVVYHGDKAEIGVTLWGESSYYGAKYVWDGKQFVFAGKCD